MSEKLLIAIGVMLVGLASALLWSISAYAIARFLFGLPTPDFFIGWVACLIYTAVSSWAKPNAVN